MRRTPKSEDQNRDETKRRLLYLRFFYCDDGPGIFIPKWLLAAAVTAGVKRNL